MNGRVITVPRGVSKVGSPFETGKRQLETLGAFLEATSGYQAM